MTLKTNYIIGDIPHAEHPSPQFMRDSWVNLNGLWNLCKLSNNGETLYFGKILVPFSPESLNSQVESGFTLSDTETLVYEREFDINKNLDQKAILHFGAVDSECKVYINGVLVGGHIGGFTPFKFDITSHLKVGKNLVRVEVTDTARLYGGARGKQSVKRGGIWYTPQSGIYQTVWLEVMPSDSIEDFKITPSVDNGEVAFDFKSKTAVTIKIFDRDKEIISLTGKDSLTAKYDFELWSPENPKLYDLIVTNESGDKVKSYFGMRSFGIVTDKKGKKRLALNGKPYYFNGLLDQGYWSDGLLTYPSDKAAIDELQTIKDMGFNTIRKHIKLEPLRWYYHCDRIGLIVWQDFVNGGGDYSFIKVALAPQIGIAKHRDDDYKFFAREDQKGREEYLSMTKEIIENLYNCVSIGVYVPFNEGWGQFDSKKVTEYVESLDPTRIVDSVSGWYDQGEENTRLKSMHIYFTPLKVPKDNRPVVLSEFGGYSLKVKDHVYDPKKSFGYKQYKTQEKFISAIEKLFLKKLKPLIEKGLSGSIYTQVSDVEEEINGLVTYDRKEQKIPTEKMKEINDQLKSVWSKIE